MIQKENEQQKEQVYFSDTLTNTVWGQVEKALEGAEKLRENQNVAFVKALKETAKANSQFRQLIKSSYDETKKANSSVLSSFKLGNTEEQGHLGSSYSPQGVLEKWENLMLTPLRHSFKLMDQLEQKSVENGQTLIENLESRRKEFLSSSKVLVNVEKARTVHQSYLHRVEDTFQGFFNR